MLKYNQYSKPYCLCDAEKFAYRIAVAEFRKRCINTDRTGDLEKRTVEDFEKCMNGMMRFQFVGNVYMLIVHDIVNDEDMFGVNVCNETIVDTL